MTNIIELINYARKNNCSDLHITQNLNPVFRRNGELFESDFKMTSNEKSDLIRDLLEKNTYVKDKISENKNQFETDFCFETPDGLRQRVNIYKQQNNYCAAIRILYDKIPTLDELNLPEILKKISDKPRGLILVTGATGSGKSTTMAAIINRINETRRHHILTIEDPIEYIHKHKNSMIHQREIGRDTESFSSALNAALREDPDIILVGEMRDLKTINAAITAAETGHLVLSTLHTTDAIGTVDRIVSSFPEHSQQQVRTQLSDILECVLSQTLVKLKDNNGRIVAYEILIKTSGVSNLIRSDKCNQLRSLMQTGIKDGMNTLEFCLSNLVKKNLITYETGLEKANNKIEYEQYFL